MNTVKRANARKKRILLGLAIRDAYEANPFLGACGYLFVINRVGTKVAEEWNHPEWVTAETEEAVEFRNLVEDIVDSLMNKEA